MTSGLGAAKGAGPSAAPLPPSLVLTYLLTTADALAWERRDPAIRRRDRVAMGGAVFGGIGLLSATVRHLPAWLSSLHSNALAVLILCLPLGLVLFLQRIDLRKRALRRIASPVGVTLEVWDRRISEQREDASDPLVLGAGSLREVIDTGDHVFLTVRGRTVIVPARAFADAKTRDEFAAHWEAAAG